MTASGAALEMRGLHKSFGATTAVDHVDLVVPAGTFCGLVGPNGAGKTTLLSMAVGLLRPDRRRLDRARSPGVGRRRGAQAKRLLGVLPDGLALPQRLTGRELLAYLGLLRGLPADEVGGRIDELLDVLDLTGAEGTLIADYSTGMRKKIGLATAVLHGPRVLVLDEPLEAVDPLSAIAIGAILGGFVAGGGTVDHEHPRHGAGGADVRPRRRHGPRFDPARGNGGPGGRRAEPAGRVRRPGRRPHHDDGTVMVRILIQLRATIANHQLRRSSRLPLLLAGLLGLAAAVGTFALGFVHHARPGAGADILATVFALWMGGQIAQSALTGGAPTLRPEIFALLPLRRRRLAHALMVVGAADPVLVLLTLAYAALVASAARSGAAAVLVAAVATVLTVALTSVLSTLAAGLLGPGSRRGRDAGTILTALALSVLALSGTLIPVIVAALDRGSAPWLRATVRGLPSGWGVDAPTPRVARRGRRSPWP